MKRNARFLRASLLLGGLAGLSSASASAQGWLVNGDFERKDSVGWTEWSAPWALGAPTYDYAAAEDPYAGASSLHFSAANGSFGVYQEVCVEAGTLVKLDWVWKGKLADPSGGNGWWEVLVVDDRYSYDAVDNPGAHPETLLAEKWELGFGGPYDAPSDVWVAGAGFELTPVSDVITVVLKCGSTAGGPVEAWFDGVALSFDTDLLGINSVEPALGKTAGGDVVKVLGRVFPEGTTVKLGGADLLDTIRLSTCALQGTTPPGAAGSVDVIVTTPKGSATLTSGFRYVAPPVVASVTPSLGPVAGDTEITIQGESFVGLKSGDVTVRVGANLLKETAITGETTITGKTPGGAAGPADITVTTPFGEVTFTAGFRYVPSPVVASVTPASGPVEGGTEITIQGESFIGLAPGDVTVKVGGNPLQDTAVTGETTITGKTPAAGAAGAADVVVTTPFGEVTVAGGFTYTGGELPLFVRGDCDSDGNTNITDAISLLNFLFLGGKKPDCLEACNADDDAQLNITDGIAILNFLFLGGKRPAPPNPDCGTDTTGTPNCEVSNPDCL